MLRANPRVLGSALFSALGLLPLACGGSFQGQDPTGGSSSGGSASGGSDSASGSASGGSANGGNGSAGKSTSGGSSSGGSASGGATQGGSAQGGSATGGGSSKFPCDNPTEFSAGYERCDNGTLHRPEVVVCPSKLPRPVEAKIAPPGDGQCTSDADCADMPHGYCRTDFAAPGEPGIPGPSYCVYGCVKDSECGVGNICLCGDPVGQCVSAGCESDAACGAGLRCQSYDPSRGCGGLRFDCQSPQDACGGDTDCPTGMCGFEEGAFTCQSHGCAVGRPFLVEGLERVAPLASRPDWAVLPALADDNCASPALCARAARAWAIIGQMEHASIAAFARFALQLLQLGAPPELIELATQAMADETRHARLAFGVASHYARSPIGPGKLDVERSLELTSLVEVVRLVLREGCIGETCAALEAREAALHAADPTLANLLSGIADDEARHAELAWRFVSWALERSPGEVAPVIERELALIAASAAEPASAAELELLPHGIVPDSLRTAVRNAALAEVIRPCGQALLARSRRVNAENPVVSA